MTDATIAVWAVVPEVAQSDALGLLQQWRSDGLRVVAPALWLAECTSAIRAVAFHGVLSNRRAQTALEQLLSLDVEVLPMEESFCPAALAWAERLKQRRAYDGFYLALAELLGAAFWTADRGLARSARDVGASWVHLLAPPVG